MEITKEEISKVAAFLMHLGQGFANLSLGLTEVEKIYFGRQIEGDRAEAGLESSTARIEDSELGDSAPNSSEGV
jgi:hypothetical protein